MNDIALLHLLRRAITTLRPRNSDDLSVASRTQLLDMSFSRLRFSIYMMPPVSVPLIAYFGWRAEAIGITLWGISYVLAAGLVYRMQKIFLADQHDLPGDALEARWLPRVQRLAWLHGAGLSLSIVATLPVATLEFTMLQYLVMAHIVSTNATHQTPTIGVFLRFFTTSWNMMILLAYWAYPRLWHIVMPLGLVYSLVIYRHALVSHRFAIEQVSLQEHSAQLAEKFRQAKEQAEEALQEKNLFLSTASHDLRQPVHAMAMLVEAISRRNRDYVISPLLADLKSSMSSMSVMFNSLLDLSKLEAGIVAQRASHVSLHVLLQGIVTMFREQARERGLTLRIHAPRAAAAVWADPALLRQALVNLVHNALRYTERGSILIGVRQRGTTWQIEVWDTGVGIAEADGPQIFSPYYRSQHAWRLHSAGHGLGLAVVARCARLMDATLDFRSRLGRGSRFWLRLPKSELAERAGPAPNDNAIRLDLPLQQLSGCCLVLDDDPQVVAAWKALLDSWGVNGRYAADSAQATQLLDAGFLPRAIFCDQRLRSGESGFEILKALLNRYPQACGAMVSGEFHSLELQEAENEGYLVLRKPLEPAQLHAVLSAWLLDVGPVALRSA
jgi:signal transduction histidine kinase/CheY-like chemotaxis protein